MPATATSLGVKDRWNFDQSSDAAARLLRELLTRYGGDKDKALAAYNWNPSGLDADIRAHGDNWRKFAPAETQKYIGGVQVIIQNQTGGSAQASVAALAGG